MAPSSIADPLALLKTKRRFLVHAKPNAKKTGLLSYDAAGDFFIVAVKAPPIEGKANQELERYFSKLLKKEVALKTGATSKTKLFETRD